jgi:hypothetical protein
VRYRSGWPAAPLDKATGRSALNKSAAPVQRSFLRRTRSNFDKRSEARVITGHYRKGAISDPVGTAKSVALTHAGLAESERLFIQLFGEPPVPQPFDGETDLGGHP